jgi:hypothetical protein
VREELIPSLSLEEVPLTSLSLLSRPRFNSDSGLIDRESIVYIHLTSDQSNNS